MISMFMRCSSSSSSVAVVVVVVVQSSILDAEIIVNDFFLLFTFSKIVFLLYIVDPTFPLL